MNILNKIILLVIEISDSNENENKIYNNKILYLKTLDINIVFLAFKNKAFEKKIPCKS